MPSIIGRVAEGHAPSWARTGSTLLQQPLAEHCRARGGAELKETLDDETDCAAAQAIIRVEQPIGTQGRGRT